MNSTSPTWTRLGPFAFALGLLLFGIGATVPASAITLTGANGKTVDFHRLESAAPKGLTAQMVADGPIIGITWDKLDLAALQRDHPEIHAAYLKSQTGETVALGEMGQTPPPGEAAPKAPEIVPPRYEGWADVKVGKIEFMLQTPVSKPRAILLIGQDDFGDAFRYLMGHERGTGVWGVFQAKFDMALLTYDTGNRTRDPTVADDFMFSEKGSGKAVFAALKQFESKLKLPGLADLPIALFGDGRSGSAFAYNFLHQFPEKILAAALYDGAFYDAPPTEASVKVPVLFMWGQYSNRHELWKSENYSVTALAKAAPMKSVWTNAREFRGRGEPSAEVDHFGRQYLIAMIEERLPKAAPAPPAPAEPAKPDDATGGAAPAAGEEPAPAPEAEVAESSSLPEIDRGSGSIGNNLTGELVRITDPEVVTGPDEAFVPNEIVARYWKGFVLGELEAPVRGK